jgi:hypothetical protein
MFFYAQNSPSTDQIMEIGKGSFSHFKNLRQSVGNFFNHKRNTKGHL